MIGKNIILWKRSLVNLLFQEGRWNCTFFFLFLFLCLTPKLPLCFLVYFPNLVKTHHLLRLSRNKKISTMCKVEQLDGGAQCTSLGQELLHLLPFQGNLTWDVHGLAAEGGGKVLDFYFYSLSLPFSITFTFMDLPTRDLIYINHRASLSVGTSVLVAAIKEINQISCLVLVAYDSFSWPQN